MLQFFPRGRAGRVRIGVTMMLSASLVTAAFAAPSPGVASGDDHTKLHHKKHRLDNRISAKTQDLDEISTKLLHAQQRVESATTDLRDARAKFDDLKQQAAAAAVRDREMQHLLRLAVIRLRDAERELKHGTAAVLTQRAALASDAVATYQTGGTAVMSLGVAFGSESAQQVVDNLQASQMVVDKQAVTLQRFEATKVLLTLTAQRVQATRDDVAKKRQDAAEILATKLSLKEQARAAKDDVATRLDKLRHAKKKIAEAKAREKQRLAKLEQEQKRVENKLRKIAAARARQHQRQSGNFTNDGGGFLSYPVMNTYITSPYGMRMHPILHVWKLHDGTDFHADCGTPVYAAAPGRVLSEYYNAGYGNRIILDHGFVRGVSLQTSYNHLTSFVARSGQQVKRGQLIAYSGTTGYSTACHLHFMVYVNGYTVNPVTWL